MSALSVMLRRSVPASGALVFRPADGAVPKGYRAFGPVWAMVLPDDLIAAGVRDSEAGLTFEKPTAVTGLRERLGAFWTAETGASLPAVPPLVPRSVAGVSDGIALAEPVSTEVERGQKIAAYATARASARRPARGIPAFADLVMRQIAVLRLPSATEVALCRDGAGDWVLEFRESGPMGHLFAEMVWQEPDKKAKDSRLECRASAMAVEAHGVLIALARAVQLVQLAVASGLGPQDRLRVEVSHGGLDGRVLAFTLRPEDRGLPLARLMRLVAGNLQHRKGLKGDLQELPCHPKLVADHSAAAVIAEKRSKDLAEPLRWHTKDDEAALRWIYSGDRSTSARYTAGLPFAVARFDPAVFMPQGRAQTFNGLSATDRGAYTDWLAGPRRADGFRPVFADLYLQGLEYRILADTPLTDEIGALVSEIRHIGGLLDVADPLSLRIASLLDWLGATGKCPTGPLSTEGPLTCLALLGTSVAQGRPLDHADRAALLRVLGEVDDVTGTVSVGWPDALVLTPPAKPLVARYVSMSGLCDIGRHVFRHDSLVVPDLRASARLRALLSLDEGGAR